MDLTQHVSLCKECRIRQGFVDKKDLEQADQCYICNNLMNKLETINNALIRKMNEGYEFGTFQIGVSLPSTYIEREDDIRSRLKVRGRNSIKNQTFCQILEKCSNML